MMHLYILPQDRAPLPDGLDLLALEDLHKNVGTPADLTAPTSAIEGAIRASTASAIAVPEASSLSFDDPRVSSTDQSEGEGSSDDGAFLRASAPLLAKLQPNFDTLARFGYNEPSDPDSTGLQSLLRRLVRQL